MYIDHYFSQANFDMMNITSYRDNFDKAFNSWPNLTSPEQSFYEVKHESSKSTLQK